MGINKCTFEKKSRLILVKLPSLVIAMLFLSL